MSRLFSMPTKKLWSGADGRVSFETKYRPTDCEGWLAKRTDAGTSPPPPNMHQYTTFPKSEPRRLNLAHDGLWTVDPPEPKPLYGMEVERIRREIPGTRCALTQFAVRNQRIVTDPFPTSNGCPRKVPPSSNPIYWQDIVPAKTMVRSRAAPSTGLGDAHQAAPSSVVAVASRRQTFNPALQAYQIREVPCVDAKDRGLAAESSCFAVDQTLTSRQWRRTGLDVEDFTSPQHRSSRHHASQKGSPAGTAITSDADRRASPGVTRSHSAGVSRPHSVAHAHTTNSGKNRIVQPEWWG